MVSQFFCLYNLTTYFKTTNLLHIPHSSITEFGLGEHLIIAVRKKKWFIPLKANNKFETEWCYHFLIDISQT